MSTRTKPKPTEPTQPVLIDNLELCAMLSVPPDTWRKRVERGMAPTPHCRMGSRAYYRRADVDAFLKDGAWPASMKFRFRKAGRWVLAD